MNTEQEQIKEMTEKMKRCFEKNGLLNFKWFAEALVQAGYGDVSEYKAEREMLGSQIKVLKQRLNNKYVEVDNLSRDYSNAFERLKTQQREIERLKAQVKQAQIDVLNKVKNCREAIDSDCYPYLERIVNKLIEEVQNEN